MSPADRILSMHSTVMPCSHCHAKLVTVHTATHQKGVPTKEFAGDFKEADPKSPNLTKPRSVRSMFPAAHAREWVRGTHTYEQLPLQGQVPAMDWNHSPLTSLWILLLACR